MRVANPYIKYSIYGLTIDPLALGLGLTIDPLALGLGLTIDSLALRLE